MGLFGFGKKKSPKLTREGLKKVLSLAFVHKKKLLKLKKDFEKVREDLVALGRGNQNKTDALRKKFGGKIPVSEHRRIEKEIKRLFENVKETIVFGQITSRELSKLMKEGKIHLGTNIRNERLDYEKDIKLQELVNQEDLTIDKLVKQLLAFLRLGRNEVGSYQYDNAQPILEFMRQILEIMETDIENNEKEIADLTSKIEKTTT